MGSDAAIRGESELCLHKSDDWTKHRLFLIVHRVFGAELGKLLVRQTDLAVRSHHHAHSLSHTYSNSYIRSEPSEHGLLSLGPYLQFWAMCYFAVTAWLTLFKSEVSSFGMVTDLWHSMRLHIALPRALRRKPSRI